MYVVSVCLFWDGGIAWHFGKEGITATRVSLRSQGMPEKLCLGSCTLSPQLGDLLPLAYAVEQGL